MPTYLLIIQAAMHIEVDAADREQAREKGLLEAQRVAEHPIVDVGPVLEVVELPKVIHGD